jgi:hypothetical protein
MYDRLIIVFKMAMQHPWSDLCASKCLRLPLVLVALP